MKNMIGLNAASEATRRANRTTTTGIEISYNTKTGEVTTIEHVGGNNWTEWIDGETVRCYTTYNYQTPQQIADQIEYWLMARDPGLQRT